ncbi:natural killer cells antigen CD94-like [Lemur catta]|uniref:natural killer cells antigen CD94-like n=1 Tax=Lemur catta TaxID=9447 RepID=UPI001E268E36|nr:natural killer cells antigen CD94-like [Lemur catta]
MAVSQTTRWRLISGTLGVICLLLMATLGILFNTSHSKTDIEPTSSPGLNKELQKGSDCCSCPEKWVGYQRNCYFISSELKTWEESRNSCVSQNSSLLQVKNRDELGFMHSSQYFYWTGLSYNEERGDWLWEDGSALSRNLLDQPIHLKQNRSKAFHTSNLFLTTAKTKNSLASVLLISLVKSSDDDSPRQHPESSLMRALSRGHPSTLLRNS